MGAQRYRDRRGWGKAIVWPIAGAVAGLSGGFAPGRGLRAPAVVEAPRPSAPGPAPPPAPPRVPRGRPAPPPRGAGPRLPQAPPPRPVPLGTRRHFMRPLAAMVPGVCLLLAGGAGAGKGKPRAAPKAADAEAAGPAVSPFAKQ